MKDLESLKPDKFPDITHQRQPTRIREKQISDTMQIAPRIEPDEPKTMIGISEHITRLKKAVEKLTQTQGRLTILNTIIKTIGSNKSVNRVVKLTVNKTSEYFKDLRVSYSTIGYNGKMNLIYSRETQGMSVSNGLKLDLSMTPEYLGFLQRRELVIIEDINGDQRSAPYGKIFSAFGSRALLGAPVADTNKTIGLLCLHSRKAHRWSNHEKKTIKDVAKYFGIAIKIARAKITNKKNEKKIKKNLKKLSKTTRYETIIKTITRRVHQSIDLRKVLNYAVAAMNKTIDGAESVSIYLVEGKEAVLKGYRGYPKWAVQRVKRIPYPRGFTWKTIIEGKPIYVDDVEKDHTIGAIGREIGTKSYASMPITVNGKPIGSININSYHKNAFNEGELQLLKQVSRQIAVAIKNASQANKLEKAKSDLEKSILERTEDLINMNKELEKEITERTEIEKRLLITHHELEKRNRYEKIVRAITQSVHQSLALREVLQNAVESICSHIDVVEHISIFLVDGSEAVMRAHKGHPDWFIDRVARIPYPKGFTWKTIIEGKPIYCPDVEKDTVIGPAGKEVRTKSYASMPLYCEGNAVGSINVHSLFKDAFDREHLKLLNDVAKQIEVAIKHAKQAEAIKESKEKYLKLIEQSNDWVWEFDTNGFFTYVNPKVREIIGYEPEELIGKTTFDFMSSGEAKRFSDLANPYFSEKKPFKRLEKQLIHKDGHQVTLEVSGTPIFDSQGDFKGYLGVVQDITERRNQEKTIHHFAMHDYLTDLPNRRLLEQELARLTNRNNSKQNDALVIIDLDNFKIINDTLGHFAGDQLLKDLSNALARIMRPRDLLARMGGDEFAILLQNVSQKEAKKIVGRLFKSINKFEFNIKGYNLNLNCSMGIALIDGESSIEEILQNAYSALYQAKTEGKNQIIHHITSKNIIKIKQASNWNIRIKEALKFDRYTIEFQPVVRLDTENTEFFEALIRMKAKNGEIVFPKAFIHAAERYGLISEIDRWMLEKITHFLGNHPSTNLSINLSGSSLRDKSLLSLIERYIKEGRISADQLIFEITELSAIRDLNSVQKWMNKLQILNARFALDDFGTGFSSFKHLQILPVDFVKIDVSFISKIKEDLSCYAIVNSIAAVAHALGKEVIAEGVENQEIIKSLRELKIEFGQGKFWKSANLGSLTS